MAFQDRVLNIAIIARLESLKINDGAICRLRELRPAENRSNIKYKSRIIKEKVDVFVLVS